MRGSIVAGLAVLGMLAMPCGLLAVPYASGVAVSGADVTFTLNQDAANVTVELQGGGTLNLGAMTKGDHVVSVPVIGSHQIKVTNSEAAGWTQISTNNTNTSFYVPVGVSVNRNKNSSGYGTVYVSNASTGTTAFGRNTAEGLYRLKADTTAVNSGTAGIAWGGSSGPFKCEVGEDDNLYVADLSNDLAFEIAPDLSSGIQLIDASNRTTNQWVASLAVTGTKAAGNRKLYLIDSNYNDTARRGIIGYNLGSAAKVATGDTGTQVIGPSWFNYYPMDGVIDSAGNWYTGQYRSDPTQATALAKFLAGSTTPAWEVPKSAPYNGSYAIALCEERGWVAYGNYYDGYVRIFDANTGGELGNFDAGSRMRDIAFDAAGNIYTVDNLTEWLKVWSPGGESALSTPFTVTVPEPAALALLALGSLALVRRRR
jgi:MYXO-CTERM domain-containing protein